MSLSIEAKAQATPDEAQRLNEQVLRLHEQGRFAEAIPLAERVVEINKRLLGPNHEEVASSLNNLAALYKAIGQYDKAEPLFLQAVEIRKNTLGDEHPDYAVSLNNLGLLYYERGQYRKAEALHLQATEIRKRTLGEDHPDFAKSLNNVAMVYYALGQYDKAEPLYVQAMEIAKRTLGEDHPHFARSLNNLAALYEAMAQYRKAEPLSGRASEILRKALGEDHRDYLSSLVNLAGLLVTTGQYQKAEPLYLRAIELERKALGEAHPGYAATLNNLATLYDSTGQYGKAEALHLRALELRKKALGEDHPAYAQSLNNLAAVYVTMGQYEKAESLYMRAGEIWRKVYGEDHREYATSLNNLAGLYRLMSQFSKAEELHLRALEIDRKALGENHPDCARDLNNLAVLYDTIGQYAKAEPLYVKAAETRREVLGNDHPAYAESLYNLAWLYQTTDRPQQAVLAMVHSMEVEQVNLRRIFGFSAEPAMRAYLSTLRSSLYGIITLMASQPVPRASDTRTALTWTLRRKAILLDTLCRFRESQSVLERNPTVAGQVSRFRRLRQRLSNLALNPPQGLEPAALQTQTAALRQECDRAEAELHRTLSAQLKEQRLDRVDTETVRQKLPRGAALLEFVQVKPLDFRATHSSSRWKPLHYFVFVLSAARGLTPRMIDLGQAESIDEAVHAVRENVEETGRLFARLTPERFGRIEKDRNAAFREVSQQLYLRTVAPLRAVLGSATRVYVAPDGELNRVPFEALVDEKGRYLAESYQFAYLSSGRDLLRRPPIGSHGTVVFGAPDYDLKAPEREAQARVLLAVLPHQTGTTLRGDTSQEVRGSKWALLAGAEAEAMDVDRELRGSSYGPVKRYLGRAALEEVFKALRSPRVLHVATHGFFLADQPVAREEVEAGRGAGTDPSVGLTRLRGMESPLLRSGLVLAGANALGKDLPQSAAVDDGWVTAEEIATMDLRGTELVVLSACESGLGDVNCGEGVYGLRRAFLYAGAQTLLTSLFKVPDQQTREMMRLFYRSLKSGKGELAALHEAELAMIRQRRAHKVGAHPFFWASFVLVGNPEGGRGHYRHADGEGPRRTAVNGGT